MLELGITFRCTKFDRSSFSRSRHMDGAHQNLNGSQDLITPLSGMLCHPWARIFWSTTFEFTIFAHYEDMKKDSNRGKLSGLG